MVTVPEIRNEKELRGKTVGISSFGGVSYHLTKLVLESFGIFVPKDVTLRPMGQDALRLVAMSGKSIQAQGVTPDIEVLQDVPDELKTRAELQGEASMRGHLAADGAEQTGSQAYVPPSEKDDKALNAAFNLLRGVTVNAHAPASAKRPVPN